MASNDYSTPRVNRFRRHAEGDHSECKPQPEKSSREGCAERSKMEFQCYYFFVSAMAANIPDDEIKAKALEIFPDWLVEFTWDETAGVEDDLEFDISLLFTGESNRIEPESDQSSYDPGWLMRLESHYWDDSPLLPEPKDDEPEPIYAPDELKAEKKGKTNPLDRAPNSPPPVW